MRLTPCLAAVALVGLAALPAQAGVIAVTADRLIEDKLGQGNFAEHEVKSDALLVSASAWALGLTARVIERPNESGPLLIAGMEQSQRGVDHLIRTAIAPGGHRRVSDLP